MSLDSDARPPADGSDSEWLARIRAADTLGELADSLGFESADEAYFEAKRRWARRSVASLGITAGLPGERVRVDDTDFVVHGITHANTLPEQELLRHHVSTVLAGGASVYCEQGIRPMYLEDFEAVHAMDDYRWARQRSADLDVDGHIEGVPTSEFEGLLDTLPSVGEELREATFSLIESGSAIYGEEFSAALGDVASDFLTSEADLATGEDFESFRKTRRAAEDPSRLDDLQTYYRRVLLPQPIERGWLRRHDRELELVTHARNERMADYAVHESQGSPVELIVGAAHQPGVVYYLEQYRDADRRPGDFEYVA